MARPVDIAHRAWLQRASHVWTDTAFRAVAMAHLDALVSEQSWASSWHVLERFQDAGIEVRVPYGDTGPADARRTLRQGFRQRAGIAKLLLSIYPRIGPPVETAAEFPMGVITEATEVTRILQAASAALIAEYRRRP